MPDEDPNLYKRYILPVIQFVLGIKSSEDETLLGQIRVSWRRRTVGVLLLVMYGFVFYIVVMSLTAYQIQTRVHALSEQGDTLNIWSVARVADRILALDTQIEDKQTDISILEYKKSEASTAQFAAEQAMSEARSALDDAMFAAGSGVSADTSHGELIDLARTVRSGLSDPASMDAAIAEMDASIREFDSAVRELELIDGRLNELRQSRDALAASRKAIQSETVKFDEIANLIDQLSFFHRSSDADRDGVLYKAFNYLFGSDDGTTQHRSSYLFVTLPSEVLIMLIVIAMGIVGSMISITEVFFRGDDRPVTFFLFQPLFGAVVAIGIYIVTKAGVIVASNQPPDATGATQLNAFFVSFVSLVAGLMSESAIAAIKRAGTGFLRGDPVTERSRYANGVTAAMAKDNKQAKDLYPFFDVAPETVDKWLSESEQVPGDAQRVIAAWLERPVRNLFSDLAARPQGADDGKKNAAA